MSAPNNQFYNDLKNEVLSIAHSQNVNKYIELDAILKDFFAKDYISIFEFADLCEIFIDELKKHNENQNRRKEDSRDDILKSIEQIQQQIMDLKKSEENNNKIFEYVLDERKNDL